jgi:MFS family permease
VLTRLPLSPRVAAKAIPAPVRRHVKHAVERKRIGNLSADRGLDVLTFFLADVQTGFGPFIAVYLAANHWNAAQVGAVLGVGSIVAIAAQVPTGIAIDASPWKRGAALVALLSVFGCAVLLALFSSAIPVYAAEVLHGVASCALVPAVAAISLSRVGRAALAARLGRNARFMALGNAIGAGLMGYAGWKIANSAPFWLAAAFTLPAILALLALPPRHETEPKAPRVGARKAAVEGRNVLTRRPLLVFLLCVLLFQTANSFMLPLASVELRGRVGAAANLWLSAALILPQGIVALISPWVGRMADRFGRRRVLLLGFIALPLRATLLGLFAQPPCVIAAQALDGAGGAMFGVLQPLVAADLTRGTNRFNLTLGVIGLATGLGGMLSSLGGGWVAQHFGARYGFAALGAVGLLAVATVALLMPETRTKGRHADAPGEPRQDAGASGPDQKSLPRPLLSQSP